MLSDLNWMWWTNLFGKVGSLGLWDWIGGVVIGRVIGFLGTMGWRKLRRGDLVGGFLV